MQPIENKQAAIQAQIATPRNDKEVYQLLKRAGQWHRLGRQDLVEASDQAMSAYFTSSRISRFIAHLPIGGSTAQQVQGYQLLQFLQTHPAACAQIFKLPFRRTQDRMFAISQAVAVARQLPFRLLSDQGTNVTREYTESLFASQRMRALCERGLPADELTPEGRAAARAEHETLANQLLAASDPLALLQSRDMRPSDLFRFFRFVGNEAGYRQLLAPVFYALYPSTMGETAALDGERLAFLLEIAGKEPRVRSLLATGPDRLLIVARNRQTDQTQTLTASRMLLSHRSDYFHMLLASGAEEQLDLRDSAFDAEALQDLIQWIGEEIEPEVLALPTDALIRRIRIFSALADRKTVESFINQLVTQLSDETLVKLVKIAIELKYPVLLQGCISYINRHPSRSVQIQCLPSGRLEIHQHTPTPPTILREACGLLARQTGRLVLDAMVIPPPVRLGSRVMRRCRSLCSHDSLDKLAAVALVVASAYFTLIASQCSGSSQAWTPWGNRSCGWVWFTPGEIAIMCIIGLGSFYLRKLSDSAEAIARTASKVAAFVRDPLGIQAWVDESLDSAFFELGAQEPDSRLIPPPGSIALVQQLSNLSFQERCGITEIDLSQCADLRDQDLLFLIRLCPRITRLVLSGVHPHVTGRGLAQLHRFNRLETLRLCFDPEHRNQLAALNIREQFGGRHNFRIELTIPVGSSPYITNSPFWHNLDPAIPLHIQAEDIPTETFIRIASLCPGLESLICERVGDEAMAALALQCRHLRLLRLNMRFSFQHTLSGEGLQSVASLPRLRHLHIRGLTNLTDEIITDLSHHENLETLELDLCDHAGVFSHITNVAMERLASMPSLRTIRITGSLHNTDAGIQSLLTRPVAADAPPLPPLEISLLGCSQVSPAMVERVRLRRSPAQLEQAEGIAERAYTRFPSEISSQYRKLMAPMHLILDALVRGNVFMLAWPIELPLPFAFLPEFWRHPNQMRTHIVERLGLAPAPVEEQRITLHQSHVRALAQFWHPQLDRRSFTVPVDENGLLNALSRDGSAMSRDRLLYDPSVIESVHLSPIALQKLVDRLLHQVSDLGEWWQLCYQGYLQIAFPTMNQQMVEDLLIGFQAATHRIVREHRTHLQQLTAAGYSGSWLGEPAATLDLLRLILTDPDWHGEFTLFLNRIREVGDQQIWSDEQKIAVLIIGMLNMASLLPKLLSPGEVVATPQENKREYKKNEEKSEA